jgi:phenylacetate-CoA ligase
VRIDFPTAEIRVTLTYFDAVSHRAMLRDYPIGPAFLARFRTMSRDELRHLQNERFLSVMRRGWEIPFYRRLWSAKGIEPGDVRSLDDLPKLPTYQKSDIMASVEAKPPLGDFHGIESALPEVKPAVVLHTTSGTTGRPQPLLFGPKTREIQNLLLARAYLLQGLRPDDVVHSVYGHGLVNGGHYIRETILHFTSALFLSAGTGVETRSRTQVELMTDFGATVLVGFIDYIRHLADVAREMGIVPGRDIKIRMISGGFAREPRELISEAWGGAETYDWYGIADTGVQAAEGPDRSGCYIWEDAHLMEIIDPDSHEVLPDGSEGNICTTVLFKDDIYPCIRFNTNDLSSIDPKLDSLLGLKLRRMTGFHGRSDNMVKLRGINVYPIALGGILQALPEATGEFVCRVDREGARDEMTVLVEVRAPATERPALAASCRELLRRKIGVDILVELVDPGATAPLTEIERRQKPIRLIDKRPKR